jgi:peptidoglycan/LPS O-acetylase OafA/YrhL
MKQNFLLKICTWIVLIVSASVLIGWFIDSATLKSLHPDWPIMKLTTALSFFLCGLIQVCHSRLEVHRAESWSQLILLLSTILMLLIVVSQITAIITGISIGLDFSFQERGSVKIATVERPSIGTTLSFFVLSLIGLCSLSQMNCSKKLIQSGGACIAAVSCIAIVGYMFSIPLLYYTVQDTSPTMALHTAILFLLLGSTYSIPHTCLTPTSTVSE